MVGDELAKGLHNVARLIRGIGIRFEEQFFLGEEIDTFASFSEGQAEDYVLELICLEARQTAGFEDVTHELKMSFREVGEIAPIYHVSAMLAPNGLHKVGDVLRNSPNALELGEFGNAVAVTIEEKWPGRI